MDSKKDTGYYKQGMVDFYLQKLSRTPQWTIHTMGIGYQKSMFYEGKGVKCSLSILFHLRSYLDRES